MNVKHVAKIKKFLKIYSSKPRLLPILAFALVYSYVYLEFLLLSLLCILLPNPKCFFRYKLYPAIFTLPPGFLLHYGLLLALVSTTGLILILNIIRLKRWALEVMVLLISLQILYYAYATANFIKSGLNFPSNPWIILDLFFLLYLIAIRHNFRGGGI